jgi:hypothetical protein
MPNGTINLICWSCSRDLFLYILDCLLPALSLRLLPPFFVKILVKYKILICEIKW